MPCCWPDDTQTISARTEFSAAQNELDEASLARLAAKQAAGGGPKPEAEEGPAAIAGGTDVASAIAANVWEVLTKVRQCRRCHSDTATCDWSHVECGQVHTEKTFAAQRFAKAWAAAAMLAAASVDVHGTCSCKISGKS